MLCFEAVPGHKVEGAGFRIGPQTSENAEGFSRESALEERLLPQDAGESVSQVTRGEDDGV